MSCVLLTRDRRSLAKQAIRFFLGQDYDRRELLVVDDGDEPVADLVPTDSRIRYVRLPERTPHGRARNRANELSSGDLIAHWDESDWMAPNRLSSQVAALRDADADADAVGVASDRLLYFRLEAGEAWCCRAPANGPIAGKTLLYRRSAWSARPYADVEFGEERGFLGALPPDRVRGLSSSALYVALVHRWNGGAFFAPSAPAWEPRPLEEVSRLLAPYRSFYVALRSGHPADAAPLVASDAGASITLCAPIGVVGGYDSLAEYLALGLVRAGARINLAPVAFRPEGLTTEMLALERGPGPEPDAPVLYFCWPRGELEKYRDAGDLYVNTMWESSRLPPAWVEPLNRARALIVPTRFVAGVCRESGVRVPIEVVPEGLDPDTYQYIDRPEREGVTALVVGPVARRKHVEEAVAGWKRAFDGDATARLILKAHYGYHNYRPDDPRISYVDSQETTRGIARWYGQADVLLALGSEGYGLPLVEGMATGLPVIALDAEGQADVCDRARDLLLPVKPARWEAAAHGPYGGTGLQAVPGVEDVADRLRWVAAHRAEARELGRAASAWARGACSVWAKGPAVLDVMERHAAVRRRLRRPRTLLVPSWGTPCGVAEYAAHLVEALPGLRVAAAAPAPGDASVLHVQHQHSLIADGDLVEVVDAARRAGVPTVVTQHTVAAWGSPWEEGADALVALSRDGADRLRARRPRARVEHIPPGCPTWFPERKARGGRVIGAFGFLAPHKGFWALLDVLRARPETELLLFSHARQPEVAARWEAAAAGLPVRRISDYLPVHEVARRLAAEADVLAFWYDEQEHRDASFAARIGLATGVPVLTSPTSWFRDLDGTTYQPASLVAGIDRLLDDSALRDELTEAAREYCHANSWSRVAQRHLALWNALDPSSIR